MPKHRVEIVAHVYMSLDSSESIMFTKGGYFKIDPNWTRANPVL